jgi:hypothetical protein
MFSGKIEDDENNMVPIAPCQIKIVGRNFVTGDDGHIMTKPRTALLQGGEDDELMAPENISASNQMQQPENIIKDMRNWVVISWICGEDQIAHGEGSKLIEIAVFT